jgi:HPt (histidine-containing phosphotransfer) domain-containing protein
MNKDDSAKIDDILIQLWRKNLPTLHERLELLDRTAAHASSGTLNDIIRNDALNIAHKLTGSLGMFGYQQGTDIARQIEQILKSPPPATLSTLPTLTAALRNTLASAL